MTTNKKNKWQNVYANAVQLIFVGIVTGVFAGAVVTIYNIFAKKGEIFSREWYAYIRENPVFIPLLLLALAIGAFLLSVAVYLVPMIQGSGIPQTEGATRGRLRFKWYREAVAMFAASLLSIFMGLSAGSEGPSLQIGAASGDTVASVLKRNEMIRRYQVTGGACAGLAVAFNAPLTGMAFAFEEAHKRVKQMCDTQHEAFDISSKGLAKLLAADGLIEVGGDGKNTRTYRFEGVSKRVMFLKKEEAEKIMREEE